MSSFTEGVFTVVCLVIMVCMIGILSALLTIAAALQ